MLLLLCNVYLQIKFYIMENLFLFNLSSLRNGAKFCFSDLDDVAAFGSDTYVKLSYNHEMRRYTLRHLLTGSVLIIDRNPHVKPSYN